MGRKRSGILKEYDKDEPGITSFFSRHIAKEGEGKVISGNVYVGDYDGYRLTFQVPRNQKDTKLKKSNPNLRGMISFERKDLLAEGESNIKNKNAYVGKDYDGKFVTFQIHKKDVNESK